MIISLNTVTNYNITARCLIPNSDTLNTESIEVKITGDGMAPKIHFSLPENHHLNKHQVQLQKDSTNIHTFKIRQIGLGVKSITSIWVLNPTREVIDWNLEPNGECDLKCLTSSGQLAPGRKQLLQLGIYKGTTLNIHINQYINRY